MIDNNSSQTQSSHPYNGYVDILTGYQQENRYRTIPCDRSNSPAVDFVANDYLGLGKQCNLIAKKYKDALAASQYSASASRLLSRNQDEAEKLEALLSSLYGKEALLYNSGYHANVGTIQALNIPGTVFLCDKLIHASMIDGLTSCGAVWKRWKHNDVAQLQKLIERNSDAERLIILVESIYSMDGDIAPLSQLVNLKLQYPNIILYVDEAHAFGVRGNRGLGMCEELGIIDDVDIIIGTFGKACASAGAFSVSHQVLKSLFINRARSFIFSTALPPVVHLWTRLMITTFLTMTAERENLKRISKLFRHGIEEITGDKCISDSHIIPLVLGDAHKTLILSSRLQLHGIDALPIRRPTVPPGGERIRFSISADMTEKNIIFALEKIHEALAED